MNWFVEIRFKIIGYKNEGNLNSILVIVSDSFCYI